MPEDKIRIKVTPRQNEILEDLNYVSMTEHPEEEWAQFIQNEVVWKRTYISAPRLFWEQAIADLESEKEQAAENARDVNFTSELQFEQRSEWAYQRVLKAYNQFIAKIRKALDKHERIQERKKLPPTPAAPDTFELVPPTPEPLDDNRLYIGISPTGTEWVHYRDQEWKPGKDLDTEIEFFMKHWQRWMSKKSPEELKRIYQRPHNAVEEQFVKLVEKPTVLHQGSVFRFLHR